MKRQLPNGFYWIQRDDENCVAAFYRDRRYFCGSDDYEFDGESIRVLSERLTPPDDASR